MTSPYFVPLISLPDIITESADYLTRAGEVVVIGEISKRHEFACVGHYRDQNKSDFWHKSGRLYAGVESQNDIVGRAP